MYIPPAFAETDSGRLHEFIEQNSFGLLVSEVDGAPFATHLPFCLERSERGAGCLLGHMARANPQWLAGASRTALAVFSGPHAYVSPSWYDAENVVPTWNYVAVHAYGPLEIVHERDQLLGILRKTVHFYEQSMAVPWEFAAEGAYAEGMLESIVGFRIPIERLEGKWKISQNHSFERQRQVERALATQSRPEARAIAALMEQRLRKG